MTHTVLFLSPDQFTVPSTPLSKAWLLLSDPSLISRVVSIKKSTSQPLPDLLKSALEHSELFWGTGRATIYMLLYEQVDTQDYLVSSLPEEKLLEYQKQIAEKNISVEALIPSVWAMALSNLGTAMLSDGPRADFIYTNAGRVQYIRSFANTPHELERTFEFCANYCAGAEQLEFRKNLKTISVLELCQQAEQRLPDQVPAFSNFLKPLHKTIVPRSEVAPKPWLMVFAGVLGCVLLVLFILGAQSWVLTQKTKKLQAEFAQIEAPLTALQQKLDHMQSYSNAKGLILSAGATLEQYQQILQEFNEFPGIVLEQMEVSSDLKKINLTGTASTASRLTQYLQKLKVSFPKINLLSSQSDGNLTRFKMEASL